nr:FecR family protein [uncultured Allomuricauda sp.]
MKTSRVEKLVVKYLTHSISKKEWDELNLWIGQSKDQKIFIEYLKINYAIEDIMSEFNTERTKDSILRKIKKDKKLAYTSKAIRVFKYAATITILLGIGYFYQKGFFANSNKEFTAPSQDIITLEFESGSLEVISEDKTAEIVNEEGAVIGTQKGNRLIYAGTENKSDELVYNQLTVPYGKRFELEFSDGTVAYLNAGSSLKYPIKFLEGQAREVFLVGEAFLDVKKDPSRPFTVNTSNNLDIRVLGTKFNVSNYPEDETTEVVLVEGSVGLQVDDNTNDVVLEPGFKGSFDRGEKNITTKPVLTSVYTSWMNGDLVFRNITFENILKRLERQYNVTIINQNQKYLQKKFNANFGNEPIETVLNYFKNTYGIAYTIDNNNITIE